MRKVLIIDDDTDIKDLIEIILSDKFSTVTSTSVKQMMDKYDINEFDIVVTDYLSEDISCITMIEAYPNQRFLIVTAYSDSVPDIRNLLKRENVDYLRKPFDISDITERIENLLRLEK